MLKEYVPAEWKTITEYEIAFDDGANNGFAFPCDADGNLLPMHECAMKNYKNCMAHPEKFERWNKKIRLHRRYKENAHGRCICGREVVLWDQYYGSCECECGRWYNLFGQELLPPEAWETDQSEEEWG